MRILIYNWRDMGHPRAGGAELYTHNVAKNWVEWGHHVTWFTSTAEGHPSVEEVDGIKIIRRGGRFGVYRKARQFYEEEASGRFDVVVDEVNTRPFLCPKFVQDVPVVALVHQVCREVWFYEMPVPVALLGRYWLEPRWLRAYRDLPVVTVSESSRQSLALYGISDAVVLREGGTSPAVLPRSKEASPTVIFVGRLTPNKRPDHALTAFELARRQIPSLRMWVVGSGPMEAKLRKRASSAVEFLGRVSEDQKYDLLARSHALLVTSVREGWGLVVSEAASVGTAAITYDVPGLRDAVAASGGSLVRANPKDLAREVIRQLSDPEKPSGSLPTSGGTVAWSEVAGGLFRELESATRAVRARG